MRVGRNILKDQQRVKGPSMTDRSGYKKPSAFFALPSVRVTTLAYIADERCIKARLPGCVLQRTDIYSVAADRLARSSAYVGPDVAKAIYDSSFVIEFRL